MVKFHYQLHIGVKVKLNSDCAIKMNGENRLAIEKFEAKQIHNAKVSRRHSSFCRCSEA